jgi:hypothetical protein
MRPRSSWIRFEAEMPNERLQANHPLAGTVAFAATPRNGQAAILTVDGDGFTGMLGLSNPFAVL